MDVLVGRQFIGYHEGEVVHLGAEVLVSLRISESWELTVSSWAVMATMPESVARRIERMEPLPAVIALSPWGERS